MVGSATEVDQCIVESELHNYIEQMDVCKRWSIDEYGAKSVKENLKRAEKGFSQHRVQKESLERSRQVGVQPGDSQGFVMCEMVGL